MLYNGIIKVNLYQIVIENNIFKQLSNINYFTKILNDNDRFINPKRRGADIMRILYILLLSYFEWCYDKILVMK